MNEVAAPEREATDRRLIAPLWHTALLLVILLTLAAYGWYSNRGAQPEAAQRTGSMLPMYLSLIVAQWALLRYVVVGLGRAGVRLRDLIGERWPSWKEVARDVAIALAVWAVWSFLEWAVSLEIGDDGAKEVSALLPRGPAEIAVWVALSLTAGFCEEVIFRGYLQRQFAALTGSALAGVLLQAVVFGVSHGYQGLRNVIAITIYGALFGALAIWRRSLKPGMILHAWTDIFSGIFMRRA